jgi:hypothetical protein
MGNIQTSSFIRIRRSVGSLAVKKASWKLWPIKKLKSVSSLANASPREKVPGEEEGGTVKRFC